MTRQKSDPQTSALHRTDVVSLIFGLLFLGVAGWWAASYYLDWVIDWDLPDAGWLLAGGLILLGLIGIVASLGRDRRGAPTATGAPTGAPTGAGDAGRADAQTTEPGTAGLATVPTTVRVDDPTADLERPSAGDATSDLDRATQADLDRPAVGDLTSDVDRPAAGDSPSDVDRPAVSDPTTDLDPPAGGEPGGHRPA